MVQVCSRCGAHCNEGDRYCASCGAELPGQGGSGGDDPLLGRTVGNAYALQEVIGVGGMGRVYRAEQSVLGRTVAVKVIHPHLLSDDQTVARFYNEARAASRLNHPNSVGIIDFGRADDGVLYLAMEYIRGKDLANVMQEEGPLPFERISNLLVGVLDALGEAHALGVVHRDLKPENIILRQFRSGGDLVKVVDFGLATIVGGGDTSITRPGLVCGTPDYMSPEQGRGEALDARGDLYSLGVMLFELLTEQLPFEDESPTKVVLRHINDQIPDPRELAPYREIPQPLVDVVRRAMAKAPGERFQSAEEFQKALREASAPPTPSGRPRMVTCAACGGDNPANMRFCGSCGARLTGRVSMPPELRPRASSPVPTLDQRRALVGRTAELSELERLRQRADGQTVCVRVVGEPGVGKTRLLEEVAERYTQGGDLVVWGQPHATGAPVPYACIKTVLAPLLGVEEDDLGRLAATEGVLEDPLTRAGVAAVVNAREASDRPRASAVGVALATAVRVALQRSDSERVVLIVDDLDRCDGLSQTVIAGVKRFIPDAPLLLLASTANGTFVDSTEFHSVDVRGLPPEEAQQLFGERRGAAGGLDRLASPGARHLPPLYLEQLHALGVDPAGDDTIPTRLADVLSQRMERLDVSARRVLQATAVLGTSTELLALREMLDSEDFRGLDTLRKVELVRTRGERVQIVHPFIRDLVEASIPAEARRQLHGLAMRVTSERGEPLEVRAHHAARAGEPMSALMLLERMGDVAMRRHDPRTAIQAFRTGLELARREMLESGELGMDAAMVTFSRKLGEALELGGDVTGADGVLREAMDLTSPGTRNRALMLLALGGVAGRRGRNRDAGRLLGDALDIAERLGDAGVAGRAQLKLARSCRQQQQMENAMYAFARALEWLETSGDTGLHARAGLELGETLLEAGEYDAAEEQLEEVLSAPGSADTPDLGAAVIGVLGRLDEARGKSLQAAERYDEAARLAAEAGDADAHARWRRSAAALGTEA